MPVQQQEMTPDAIDSMFPRRGLKKDLNTDRIAQALSKHDLISRVKKMLSPGLGERSMDDEEVATDIMKAASLSLDEAKIIVGIMRKGLV
jgi:hypothetical protein